MTTTILCLVGLLVGSWLYHAWQLAQWTNERQRLVNAAVARDDPAAFVALERERTRTPRKSQPKDDDEWMFEQVGVSGS